MEVSGVAQTQLGQPLLCRNGRAVSAKRRHGLRCYTAEEYKYGIPSGSLHMGTQPTTCFQEYSEWRPGAWLPKVMEELNSVCPTRNSLEQNKHVFWRIEPTLSQGFLLLLPIWKWRSNLSYFWCYQEKMSQNAPAHLSTPEG